MDNGSQYGLTLRRMPMGGFVISQANSSPGQFSDMYFAATDIDAALKFMRDAINPISSAAPGR